MKQNRSISAQETSTKYSFRIIFISILFLLITSISYTQQLPRFSQYMMNEFILNPSVAGYDGMTSLNVIARQEWYTFGNSMRTPRNVCFSAQTRLLKNNTKTIRKNNRTKLQQKRTGRTGLGFSIFTDNSGALTKSSAQLAYAHHISIGNSQLSFGLAGSMSQFNFNADYLDFYDNDNERMLLMAESPAWMPDFNAGINLQTPKYHIGFSVYQIFQSPYVFGNPEIEFNTEHMAFKRNYHFIASGNIDLRSKPQWTIQPSALLKMYNLLSFKEGYSGPASQLDLSLKFFYDKKYWLGFSYRTLAEFIVMGGLKLSNYYLSYSFDYGMNELYPNTLGSHEIAIAVKFGDSTRRYRWMERY